MVWRASKHTGGHPNTLGASKHTRGIQTYGVSKHMGDIQTYRGIQTYGGVQTYGGYPNIQGHPNICGMSKHMGASKCIGAYGHPLSLTKHAFFVLCMYRGIQTSSTHTGGIQTYRVVPTYRGHFCMPSYPAKWVLPLVFKTVGNSMFKWK